MSSSVSLAYKSDLTAVITPGGQYDDPNDSTVSQNGLNEEGTLTATTTPPVTLSSAYRVTQSSGAATIDLTAFRGLTANESLNATGLKLQLMKLRNLSTNTHKISVTKGASNGYGLDSAGTSWTVVLDPGQSVLFFLDDAAPDVGNTAKTIDVSGTGSEILEVQLNLG